MWKKSLINLIGAFGLTMMLSSCVLTIDDTVVPVGGVGIGLGDNDNENETPPEDIVKDLLTDSPEKNITGFSLSGGEVGTIDQDASTIIVEVKADADLTALKPIMTITGESVSPASGVKQDFTNPVIYTVTAANNSTKEYTVTVIASLPPHLGQTKVLELTGDALNVTMAFSQEWGYGASFYLDPRQNINVGDLVTVVMRGSSDITMDGYGLQAAIATLSWAELGGWADTPIHLGTILKDIPFKASGNISIINSGVGGILQLGFNPSSEEILSDAHITFTKFELWAIRSDYVPSDVFNSMGLIGDATPSGWGEDTDMVYDSSTDNWKRTLTLTEGGLKFRANDDWAFNWGSETFPTGTGVSGGANIPTTAGTYIVTFSSTTGEYDFRLAPISSMGLVGSMTGWGGSADIAMGLVNNVYSAQAVLLTAGDQFKFRANSDWSFNWGGTELTGTAIDGGSNIAIPATGIYNITFNPQLGTYSVVLSAK